MGNVEFRVAALRRSFPGINAKNYQELQGEYRNYNRINHPDKKMQNEQEREEYLQFKDLYEMALCRDPLGVELKNHFGERAIENAVTVALEGDIAVEDDRRRELLEKNIHLP